MSETTELGFPKGRAAKTLRTLLYKDLSDHDVEAIVVSLLSHLLVEDNINSLLYHWLSLDLPQKGGVQNISVESGNKKMESALWSLITKLQFSQKYKFIEPIFKNWFPPIDSADIWKLNDLRNEIFHGRTIKDIKFHNKSIGTEEGIEEVFITAQAISKRFEDLTELIDHPHALAKKWSERLKELGEPLL